jgi:hypothetical protein
LLAVSVVQLVVAQREPPRGFKAVLLDSVLTRIMSHMTSLKNPLLLFVVAMEFTALLSVAINDEVGRD